VGEEDHALAAGLDRARLGDQRLVRRVAGDGAEPFDGAAAAVVGAAEIAERAVGGDGV